MAKLNSSQNDLTSLDKSDNYRRTRRLSKRFEYWIRTDRPYIFFMCMLVLIAAIPSLFLVLFPVITLLVLYHNKVYIFKLPIMLPASARRHYKKDLHRTRPVSKQVKLKGQKVTRTIHEPQEPNGIFYLGNHQDTNEEIWYDMPLMCTHIAFIATTGGGKTYGFTSMMMNYLIMSGAIYSDAKADLGLVENFIRIAFRLGRINCLQIISFQAGNRSPWQISSREKISHTYAPFGTGSAPMIIETFKSLIDGDGDIWAKRADNLTAAELKPLVYMRDKFFWQMGFGVIAEYFELEKIGELASIGMNQHPTLKIPKEDEKYFQPLINFAKNLPGLTPAMFSALIKGDKEACSKISSTVRDQLGYVTMQLVNVTNDLIGEYGHIFECGTSQVDMQDAIFNRRIVLNLLPAMERSESSMARLGQLVLIGQKAAIANGMPYELDGDLSAHIESMPVAADYPLTSTNDEAGSFLVEGISVMASQARSLRASFAVGGQDIPGMKKRSQQIEKEVETILGSTVTKIIGSTLDKETIDRFIAFAGEAKKIVASDLKIGGTLEGLREESYRIEKENILTPEMIAEQKEGQVILFTRHKINHIQLPSFHTKETGMPVSNFYLYETIPVIPKPIADLEKRREFKKAFRRAIEAFDTFSNEDIDERGIINGVASSLSVAGVFGANYFDEKKKNGIAQVPTAEKLFLVSAILLGSAQKKSTKQQRLTLGSFYPTYKPSPLPTGWQDKLDYLFTGYWDEAGAELEPQSLETENENNSTDSGDKFSNSTLYDITNLNLDSVDLNEPTESQQYDEPDINLHETDIESLVTDELIQSIFTEGQTDLIESNLIGSDQTTHQIAEENSDDDGEGSGGFSLKSELKDESWLSLDNLLKEKNIKPVSLIENELQTDQDFKHPDEMVMDALLDYDTDIFGSVLSKESGLEALKHFNDSLI